VIYISVIYTVIYPNGAPPSAINKTLHTEYKHTKPDANTWIPYPKASPEEPTLQQLRELAGRSTKATLVVQGPSSRLSQSLPNFRPLSGI
jgi:hypothetical protein